MRPVNIKLSVNGVQKAIDLLGRLEKNLTTGLEDAIKEIAEEGAAVAEANNNIPASVESGSDGNGNAYATVAQSDPDIVFVEFGAGYETNEKSRLARPVEEAYGIKVEPAEYSAQHYGEFFFSDALYPGQGFWHLGGTVFEGGHETELLFNLPAKRYKVYAHNGLALAAARMDIMAATDIGEMICNDRH